jgi:SpoVK/Ycf46/Vps4 family AAA+-type ATPase
MKLPKKGKSLKFVRELNTMLCATMAVWAVTQEEERFLRLFRNIAELHRGEGESLDKSYQVFSWSITEGLLDLMPDMISDNGVYRKPTPVMSKPNLGSKAAMMEKQFGLNSSNEPEPVKSFSETYDYIMSNTHSKVYIFKDVHNLLNPSGAEYASMVRRIKDLIYHIRVNNGSLIFLSPSTRVCEDFEKDIQIINMPRPDEFDINILLDTALTDMSEGANLKLDIDYYNSNGDKISSGHKNAEVLREKIVQNLKGLTETEICQIIAYTCVKNKGLQESCVKEIKDSKKQIIEKSGALKYIEVANAVGVGGHEEFKRYITERGLYFNKQIRDMYNLKAPKGVLLVGVPGSGKSLMARYIGGQWNIPVIRLNFDSVFGKYLGESESNLNNALAIAEASAPCILWIDELEKALGGSGSGDSGVSLRILGKILTWMQERDEMVYLFATANNVNKLPPELQRAGRFDAKFWSDLPTITECRDIFDIKTKENGFTLEFLELMQLANEAHLKQMTGAEIEHAVIQGVYAAAVESATNGTEKEITCQHVFNALKDINSHASSHKTTLETDRKKALQDYQFTSKEVRETVEASFKNKLAS